MVAGLSGSGSESLRGGVPQYSSCEAWGELKSNHNAQLIDVRTVAEWSFVGVPVLEELGKRVGFIEWQGFPSGEENPNFIDEVKGFLAEQECSPEGALCLFLCRSGQRSQKAALAMRGESIASVNVHDGFEGGVNAESKRQGPEGWKFAKLPWKQG